ncbi:MAG: type ISP restriction/modification enzyme [Roseateles sp.]
MRKYLRQRCQDIWVIDCSPEGHQPEVGTRLFQGVQQPVCIVIASRRRDNAAADDGAAKGAAALASPKLAAVHFRALPAGHRKDKFAALAALRLDDGDWQDCPAEPRAPFLPAAVGAWAAFPALEDFFVYDGSGVMPGRTWVIAPDAESLRQRWERLVNAPAADKEALFHPHLVGGKLGDRHVSRKVSNSLAGYQVSSKSVGDESGDCLPPVRLGFRSFDRQWIIPDIRIINRPNPQLWVVRSDQQVFISAFTEESPSSGPAFTVTGLVPDLHHYKDSFGGRVFPLWADAAATVPNLHPSLLTHLSACYGQPVTAAGGRPAGPHLRRPAVRRGQPARCRCAAGPRCGQHAGKASGTEGWRSQPRLVCGGSRKRGGPADLANIGHARAFRCIIRP